MSKLEYIYVVYGNLSQLYDFIQQNKDKTVIPINDEYTIRGRSVGQVIYLDGAENRWDYQGIVESIDRQQKIWGVENEVIELDEDDVSYGI